MIEKAVIYNTIDRTGMCPEDVYNQKELPIWVAIRVDLTRVQMKELFNLWDRDHVQHTNRFWEKLLWYMHEEMLEWVSNDKVVPFKEQLIETTIPKKYYIDAWLEEDLGNVQNAHRPYGEWDGFIR